MADTVVSTGTVEPAEREAFWHHLLADTFAAVQLERWNDHPRPAAEISTTRRGRLLFAELTATPHVHRRTPRQIGQADATYLQLAILTQGAATLEQDGRIARPNPGDLIVYENARPFTWTFTQPWAVTVLSVPSDAVTLTGPQRQAMSARPFSGRDGLSGVVTRLVLDLTRHASQIPIAESERILAQTSDLAISLLATASGAGCADARHRTLLHQVKDHIATHLHDPGLTPDDIAAAVHISTRYLHKLFQSEHETVALYLRGQRLQTARRRLLDPRLAGRGIAAIAHGCGFSDLIGFNRAFKATYGVTPSDLRNPAPPHTPEPAEPAGA